MFVNSQDPEIILYHLSMFFYGEEKLLCVAAGEKELRPIKRWLKREEIPPATQMKKLATLHDVIAELKWHDADGTIIAWLKGMNPDLGNRNPLMVLSEGGHKDFTDAARSWITNG